MRVELWRLGDDRPFNTHDIGVPVPEEGLAELAIDILVSYYEGDDRFFWPKPSYGDRAPQGVRIIDDSGRVLSRYNVYDWSDDTGRELVDRRPE
jgi:hypothetical protein